jgi:hypothetical protein
MKRLLIYLHLYSLLLLALAGCGPDALTPTPPVDWGSPADVDGTGRPESTDEAGDTGLGIVDNLIEELRQMISGSKSTTTDRLPGDDKAAADYGKEPDKLPQPPQSA